jgi:hypothetical protein
MAKTDNDNFQLIRTDTIHEFYCERCSVNKKSKTTVKWSNPEGITKTICNGCYGLLLSKIPKNSL